MPHLTSKQVFPHCAGLHLQGANPSSCHGCAIAFPPMIKALFTRSRAAPIREPPLEPIDCYLQQRFQANVEK